MTIRLREHDSSRFIMFRQVEVIRSANGSGASARRRYVRSNRYRRHYVRRYIFTLGLIALGCAKKLDSFFIGNPNRINAGLILIRY